MPTKQRKTKRPAAGALPATLEGRYILTVYGWNGPGGGKAVLAFDTRGELLDHLADVVTAGKGPRVGPEEVYVVTILDREQGEKRGRK